MPETSAWEKASPGAGGPALATPAAAQEAPSHTEGWPPRGSYASPSPPDSLAIDFVGRRRAVFWLALKTGCLTVLTLGLYRFWMKTRLRRWYWSATRPGGTPLEYVGDPYEKLLGFLVAVVILAFYIGVVNLALMFVSFSLFQQNYAAYALSFLGVIPLWFYARYRARRYVLARTRWRGVRFGMAPGAWGYVWRAMMHWTITLLSLGLLWPRMTFWLEKYRTDRTYFGNARLTQGGRWTMLYRATWPLLAALLLGGLGSALALGAGRGEGYTLILAAWGLAAYGYVYYRVETTRLLANHKSAMGLALTARPRPFRILMITVLGTLATALVLALPLGLLGFGVALVQFAQTEVMQEFGELGALLAALPRPLLVALGVALYFAIFLLWATFTHAWVTMPTWRHYATTLTIHNSAALSRVSQRARDEFQEAEGFAEALDLGGLDMTVVRIGAAPEAYEATGLYFDGDTAIGDLARVTVDEAIRALKIARIGAPPLHWPLDALRLLPDQGGGDLVILHRRDDPVARLILDDALLLERLPDVRRPAPLVNRGRLAAWALAAVASVALIVFVLVPALANQMANFIPPEGERALGAATLEQIRGALDETGMGQPVAFCETPQGRAALETIRSRLAPGLPAGQEISVHVLDHEMINAFVLPGGYVVFFRGLLQAAESPEEVAAVFAHELGHVVSRDPTRHALRSAGSIGVLGLLFGDFAGGALVLLLAEQLIEASYSREAEAAADAFARDLLLDTGITPAALGSFFDRLRRTYGEAEGFLAHFTSHPALSERILAAETDLPPGFAARPVLGDAEWSALQTICN